MLSHQMFREKCDSCISLEYYQFKMVMKFAMFIFLLIGLARSSSLDDWETWKKTYGEIYRYYFLVHLLLAYRISHYMQVA